MRCDLFFGAADGGGLKRKRAGTISVATSIIMPGRLLYQRSLEPQPAMDRDAARSATPTRMQRMHLSYTYTYALRTEYVVSQSIVYAISSDGAVPSTFERACGARVQRASRTPVAKARVRGPRARPGAHAEGSQKGRGTWTATCAARPQEHSVLVTPGSNSGPNSNGS